MGPEKKKYIRKLPEVVSQSSLSPTEKFFPVLTPSDEFAKFNVIVLSFLFSSFGCTRLPQSRALHSPPRGLLGSVPGALHVPVLMDLMSHGFGSQIGSHLSYEFSCSVLDCAEHNFSILYNGEDYTYLLRFLRSLTDTMLTCLAHSNLSVNINSLPSAMFSSFLYC